MNKNIKNFYYNIKYPSAFSSVKNVYNVAKDKKLNVTLPFVKNWMNRQEVYSINRYPIRKFQRSQFVSSEIDRFWSIDLIQISNPHKNDNFKFILVAIDNLSKFAWLELLKNKNSQSIINSFTKIFKLGRKPLILISDAGKEFNNIKFKNFLDKNKIKLYIMRNTEIKSSIAERLIRTLKEKIFKFLYHYKKDKFIDKLNYFVNNYNNTVHRTTLYKPNSITEKNKYKAFLNIHRKRISNQISELKIGDKVRLLKLKTKFEKGYKHSWTKEIFLVKRKLFTLPICRYIIEDLKNNELVGTFYEKELLKVN